MSQRVYEHSLHKIAAISGITVRAMINADLSINLYLDWAAIRSIK